MKNKLLYIAFGFVFMWTLGEVFNVSHLENIIFTFSSVIATAIWMGIHKDIKSFFLHRAH